MDIKTVRVNDHSFTYDSSAEALRQFRLWLAQAIHFGRGKGGTYSMRVAYGARRLHVCGFDHSGVAVYDEVKRTYWSGEELRTFRASVPFPVAVTL